MLKSKISNGSGQGPAEEDNRILRRQDRGGAETQLSSNQQSGHATFIAAQRRQTGGREACCLTAHSHGQLVDFVAEGGIDVGDRLADAKARRRCRQLGSGVSLWRYRQFPRRSLG